jgi:hypothetical protein
MYIGCGYRPTLHKQVQVLVPSVFTNITTSPSPIQTNEKGSYGMLVQGTPAATLDGSDSIGYRK